MRAIVVTLASVAAAFAVIAAPSRAAFPGADGRLAFTDIYGINLIAADGSGHDVLSPLQSGEREPAWSPDGTNLAFAAGGGRTFTIGVMAPDRSGRVILTDGDEPAWAPDGRWIAFSRYDGASATRDVWIMRSDGSDQRRLTSGTASERSPAWSPDGKRIAFVTNRDLLPDGKPNTEIYSMKTDGSDQVDLTRDPGSDDHPNWSPDGTKIAFDRNVTTGDIWLMDADGGGQAQLTHDRRSRDPAWSPDGKSIVYSSAKDDWGPVAGVTAYRLFVMSPDGQLQRIVRDTLAPGDFDPDWQALPPPLSPPGPPPVVNPPKPRLLPGALRLTVPRSIRARRGSVRFSAGCPAGTTGCAGKLELRTLRPVRCSGRGKPISILGSTRYSVRAGGRALVRIGLSRVATGLVRCRGRLPVKVRALPANGAAATSKTFTLLRAS